MSNKCVLHGEQAEVKELKSQLPSDEEAKENSPLQAQIKELESVSCDVTIGAMSEVVAAQCSVQSTIRAMCRKSDPQVMVSSWLS